jgi:hypothetical protein
VVGGSSEKKAIDLEFPAGVPQELQPSAQRIVEGLEKTVAQQVLDEWAGIIAASAIHSSPLGCLRGLVKRAQEVTFSPARAIGVAERHQVQRRSGSAEEQARRGLRPMGSIVESHPLVQRLTEISKRHRQD